MNWILETYSDVYSTAMMHDVKARHHAPANRKSKTLNKIVRFFHRDKAFGLFVFANAQ